MATGKIFYPKSVILYNGPHFTSGTLTLSDSMFNYDLLIITTRTNVDLFTYVISPLAWVHNNSGDCTFLLQGMAAVDSTSWSYRSQIGIRPTSPTALLVSESHNNGNWTQKIIHIQGIRLG